MMDDSRQGRRLRAVLSSLERLAKRVRSLGRAPGPRADSLSEDLRRDIGLADGRPTVGGAKRATERRRP